ncbi:hypothetical protein D3C80_1591580 [compost metagenome]
MANNDFDALYFVAYADWRAACRYAGRSYGTQKANDYIGYCEVRNCHWLGFCDRIVAGVFDIDHQGSV